MSVKCSWGELLRESLEPHPEVGRADKLNCASVRDAQVGQHGSWLNQRSHHLLDRRVHSSLQHLDLVLRQQGGRAVQVRQGQR